MKRVLFAMVVAVFCAASGARAQTPGAAAARVRPASDGVSAGRPSAAAVLAQFDRSIVKEFREAWQRAKFGLADFEAVVLIVRSDDGSYKTILPTPTYELRQFTFHWQPGTIAVVHTHPNDRNPKPQAADIEVADRYQVPMFTLTNRGMFLYDPSTKVISLLQDGLDWQKYAKWARYAPAMPSPLAARR